MAVDDVYQISVVQLVGSKEVSNVFYYQETDVTTLTPAVAAAQIIDQFWFRVWDASWRIRVSNQVELSAIWGRRIWPVLETPIVQPFISEFGVSISQALPANTCVLISTRTATRSANFNRRTYVSGVPESSVNLAELTDSAFVDMQNLAALIAEHIIVPPADPAAKFAPAAFSKKLDSESDPDPARLLTRYIVQQKMRTQRQRALNDWISS